MELLDHPCYTGLVSSHHDEQVFGIEAEAHKIQDDLYMGHALDTRAYFVLAFHNQYPIPLEHAFCLNCGPDV